MSIFNWFSTSLPRPFNGERIVFSTNGTGATGQPHTNEWSWTLTSYHIQKLTQNRSKTYK